MITSIVHVVLVVREYDEALAFYCGKLGFQVVEDTPLPQGKRWILLKPPGGGGSDLLLSRAVDDSQRAHIGNQTGGRVLFFLQTDDFEADFAELKLKGVTFCEEPRDENYGRVAVLTDLYGNRIDLLGPVSSQNFQILRPLPT